MEKSRKGKKEIMRMYSAVYSVKTHNEPLTALVIGRFFHSHGITRIRHKQYTYTHITQDKKQTTQTTNQETKEEHVTINGTFLPFSHSQGPSFERVRGSRYFVIE